MELLAEHLSWSLESSFCRGGARRGVLGWAGLWLEGPGAHQLIFARRALVHAFV